MRQVSFADPGELIDFNQALAALRDLGALLGTESRGYGEIFRHQDRPYAATIVGETGKALDASRTANATMTSRPEWSMEKTGFSKPRSAPWWC